MLAAELRELARQLVGTVMTVPAHVPDDILSEAHRLFHELELAADELERKDSP